MRNERNELQQLVDANLSALQWDEWHSRAVMRKIRSHPSRRRSSFLPRMGIAVSAAAALAAAVLLVLTRWVKPTKKLHLRLRITPVIIIVNDIR